MEYVIKSPKRSWAIYSFSSVSLFFFIFRRLQEKYFAANNPLYIAFVDLEKAFNTVPRKVQWWALRSVGVEEWAIRIIQVMYTNARSRVRVNGQYSEEFGTGVGVNQGPGLSPLFLY